MSGWLVLGLLVAGGVVWQAPVRAVRYTLIVASTEHELSPGCCRVVYPDLPDADRIGLRRPLLAAAFFVVTDEQLDAKTSVMREVKQAKNWGLRNAQRNRILATPQYKRSRFAGCVVRRKTGRSAVVGAGKLRDADKKTGLTFAVLLGTVKGCQLNGGGTK